PPVRELGDACMFERLVDTERVRVQRAHHRHELAHSQVAQEAARLQHRANAPGGDCFVRRQPEDGDVARVRLLQPEQHVDRRRLARAVRPEQRHRFPGRNLHVDAAHRAHRPVCRAIRLLDPAQLDSVCRCPHGHTRSKSTAHVGSDGDPAVTDAQELGRGARLRGSAASELVDAAFAAESAHGPRLAHGLSLADLAHAVALVEGGDLHGDDARALMRGLLELHEIPGDAFPWDPSLGDAFNAREAELERRVGRSAAGWLSAGRPRREAFRVAVRLTARSGVLDIHEALVAQARALAGHAAATRSALAVDYTYLQPAQPTTVGHLLLAYAYPALRDADRARASHAALGASVAGAGGSAGSRWSLDRVRLAELLGCDGIVEHAKDAAWQADAYLELLANLAIAATHQSELGQDFEIYASQEFGLLELADAHSRASALMPQKKNPYALVAIRTQAAQAAADVTGAFVVLHSGSARTDHFHLLNGLVPRAVDEAAAIARLTASVLEGIELRLDRFAEIAHASFVTAADV